MLNKYNLDRDTGGSFLPNRTKKSVSEIVLDKLFDGWNIKFRANFGKTVL